MDEQNKVKKRREAERDGLLRAQMRETIRVWQENRGAEQVGSSTQ
jgi:hypothetical protein